MSDRYNMVICFDGRSVDTIFCMNSGFAHWLIDAFKTYKKYCDCKSAEEYMERMIQESKMKDPEFVFNKEEHDEFVEMDIQFAEYQLILDFTNHCIYGARRPGSMEWVCEVKRDSLEMMNTIPRKKYDFDVDYFADFLFDSVFWMDDLDVDEILYLADMVGKDFYRKYY